MPSKPDPFRLIRKAKTSAPNYDLDTEAIIGRLQQWQSFCEFEIIDAADDTVDLEFLTMPQDLDAFVQEVYQFCPDIVDQGTACLPDMLENDGVPGHVRALAEGLEPGDGEFGIRVLKRQIERTSSLGLWWD
jgi:hypothetical protein